MNKFKYLLMRIFNFNQIMRDQWVTQVATGIAPGSKVLDVAAGTCPYKHLFSECDYKTQDFGQLLPEQQKGKSGYGKLDYICDATSIPVPDSSFDCVICTEALEHVSEPILVVREIGRILKSGGKIILTAPLGSGLHQEPFHFYGGFTPHWYNKYLNKSGFSDIIVTENGGTFKHFSQEAIRMMWLSAPWKFSIGLPYKIIWIPIWILFFPTLCVLIPLACHVLDKFDKEKKFTIGYHVVATKI